MMKVLVSGSGGLIGSALVRHFSDQGISVVRLIRGVKGSDSGVVSWDPHERRIDRRGLDSIDAVVHLAGENIGAGRWTAKRKLMIIESRVTGTRFLCETLAQLAALPVVFACASAIGIYGNRADELLDETSDPGTGFLADVCRAWEAATKPAAEAGMRVVHLRIGMVLSGAGGALARMLPPFRLGLGGPIGHGRQYMSWVAIEDVVRAIHYCLTNPALTGPVNIVAPNPVTNKEFTRVLGRVLWRPTVLPMPAALLRLALGEMANDLLLSSTRVTPTRLIAEGFEFRFPDLEGALRHELHRPA
ncbi:MAG TPA: TIGR01777 family oxidoreductase [Candidatus Deferrimicrobium sp.]|nr:TIGR01777 family oxidoreductase [Candidatus Deferrimicrobium sp.]